MKVILNIIKYVVVIILSISIILTVATNIISSTVLNQEYILGKLEETNYYNNIYNQAISNFENYIYQSGLDEEVLKGIIYEEEIKTDTEQIISNIYEGKVTEVDTNKIRVRLQENIYNSLSNQKISDSTKNAINQFIDKIIEEYKNTIIHTKYETNINDVLSKIINYLSKINNILIIVDVISVIVLLLLNIKNISKGFAQLGISLCTTGFFYIIVNIIINVNVKIDHITIFNNGFSMSIKNILHNILDIFNNTSIFIALLGIVIIVISNSLLYKDSEKEKLN